MADYLIRTDRLGMRNWQPQKDLSPMSALNQDPKVMEFFPSLVNQADTLSFINKNQKACEEKGYCFFAADLLETKEFIGFIGLQAINFDAPFTPGMEIGWRLAAKYWGNGYATEGARACLAYAFQTLHQSKVYSFTATVNHRSENVMQKIGMKKTENFLHPKVEPTSKLSEHVLYEIIAS